jgi:DNA-binding HxlR family transcriptional regulator
MAPASNSIVTMKIFVLGIARDRDAGRRRAQRTSWCVLVRKAGAGDHPVMAASRSRLYSCHVELALDLLGGKWKPIILAHLKQGPLRYGELRARIRGGLSDKMLSQRLRDLEEQELISRQKSGGRGARSVYKLTSRSRGLRPALQALHDWGKQMAPEVGAIIRE